MNKVIGFIGVGNMGKAILDGFLAANMVDAKNIIASRLDGDALEKLKNNIGIQTTLDNTEVARKADILFLAVKPDIYKELMFEIKDTLKTECMIVNMAAGISIADMENIFNPHTKMVRIMPNTPVMVGEGMIAVSFNNSVSSKEQAEMKELLDCLGTAEIVPEQLMDAVVGVSGSSPAIYYMILEAFADGAVKAGMPREQAYTFAAQAMLGSAKMVLETGIHPGELKDQVTSPGGTTIDAVAKAEETGLRHSILASVDAAVKKSKKMNS